MSVSDIRQKAWSAALIVLFFVAWELFCVMTGMSDLVLPRPSQVFVTLFEKFPILWPHIVQTLVTTMIGFVLGVALGVALGAVIGVSKTAYDTCYPLLVGFSSIPKVAVVPIFVLWFGSGSVVARPVAMLTTIGKKQIDSEVSTAGTVPELEDVLKALEKVGCAAAAALKPDDGWVDKGIDSFDVMKFVDDANQQWGCTLDATQAFSEGTATKIAAKISASMGAAPAAPGAAVPLVEAGSRPYSCSYRTP